MSAPINLEYPVTLTLTVGQVIVVASAVAAKRESVLSKSAEYAQGLVNRGLFNDLTQHYSASALRDRDYVQLLKQLEEAAARVKERGL